MRGTITYLTLVSFVVTNLMPVVVRADSCNATLLKPLTAPLEARLAVAVAELKARGVKLLLDGYENHQYRVEYQHEKYLTKPMLVKIRARRKSSLIVRALDFSTPRGRETTIWGIAKCLYELELATSLKRLGKTKAGSEVWRDARLAQISSLQEELYKLLSVLPEVKNLPNILRPYDPAQNFGPRLRSIYHDPVRLIDINRADWEMYNTDGLGMPAINQKNRDRYASLLVRVYRMHRVIRAIQLCLAAITFTAGTALTLDVYDAFHPRQDDPMITDQEFDDFENSIIEGKATQQTLDAFMTRLHRVGEQHSNKLFTVDAEVVYLQNRLAQHENEITRLMNDHPIPRR